MVSKSTSIAIGDHYREFAARKVAEGRYGSTSEVVRAGLRLLEAEEQKFEALNQALEDGENSGPGEPFDIDEFLKEMHLGLRG